MNFEYTSLGTTQPRPPERHSRARQDDRNKTQSEQDPSEQDPVNMHGPVGPKRVSSGWKQHWEEFLECYPLRDGDRGMARGQEIFKALIGDAE